MQRRVDGAPLGQQLRQHLGAGRREAIEPFVAPAFLAPFAVEQSLAFEAAQQRIEGALVDLEALIGEELAQGVAVLLRPQRRQHGHRQAAAPELEAEVLKQRRIHAFLPCDT